MLLLELKPLLIFQNERGHHGKIKREEQLALDRKNQELVELEEQQFQEYAAKVIDHADRGGRNTIPLKKAAREGAGGGLGEWAEKEQKFTIVYIESVCTVIKFKTKYFIANLLNCAL